MRNMWVLMAGLVLGASPVASAHPAGIQGLKAIVLPGVPRKAGFDDMTYSPALHRVLVPGGRSGRLYILMPMAGKVGRAIRVTASNTPTRLHGHGTTSVAYAKGYFIASDHHDRTLAIIKASDGKVVRHVKLRSGSDYVRYVKPINQVWVTEPRAQQIQTFTVSEKPHSLSLKPYHIIKIPGGPESLVIDRKTGQAYTNLWKRKTLAIDLKTQKVVSRWSSSCHHPHGLALDALKQVLFVGCGEGRAVALNLANKGAVLASHKTGAGVDIIAWNPKLGHLYVPGARSATLTILAFTKQNRFRLVRTVKTAKGAHCVTTNKVNAAFVCAPRRGIILFVKDRKNH